MVRCELHVLYIILCILWLSNSLLLCLKILVWFDIEEYCQADDKLLSPRMGNNPTNSIGKIRNTFHVISFFAVSSVLPPPSLSLSHALSLTLPSLSPSLSTFFYLSLPPFSPSTTWASFRIVRTSCCVFTTPWLEWVPRKLFSNWLSTKTGRSGTSFQSKP